MKFLYRSLFLFVFMSIYTMQEEVISYKNLNPEEQKNFLGTVLMMTEPSNPNYFARYANINLNPDMQEKVATAKSHFVSEKSNIIIINLINDFAQNALGTLFEQQKLTLPGKQKSTRKNYYSIIRDYLHIGIIIEPKLLVKKIEEKPFINIFVNFIQRQNNTIQPWLQDHQDIPLSKKLIETFLIDILLITNRHDITPQMKGEYTQNLSQTDTSIRPIAAKAAFKKLILQSVSYQHNIDPNWIDNWVAVTYPFFHDEGLKEEVQILKNYFDTCIKFLRLNLSYIRSERDLFLHKNLLFNIMLLEYIVSIMQTSETEEIIKQQIWLFPEKIHHIKEKIQTLLSIPPQEILQNIETIQSSMSYTPAEKTEFITQEKEKIPDNIQGSLLTNEEILLLSTTKAGQYIVKAMENKKNLIEQIQQAIIEPLEVQELVIPEIQEELVQQVQQEQVQVQPVQLHQPDLPQHIIPPQRQSPRNWKTFAKWGIIGTAGFFALLYAFKKLQQQRFFKK